MITFLRISRAPENKALLNASFYKISDKKVELEKTDSEFTAEPVEFVTRIIKGLQEDEIPVRFYQCNPDVPKDVQALLFKSLMAHYRATLPEHHSLIKICKEPKKKNSITAVHFESEESAAIGAEPAIYSGNPIKVAAKIIESLDAGYRNPAKLEFEEGIPQKIKDLFSEVIAIYNKSVEPW